MFAEAELSSGEESTEMEDISETTRLVSREDVREARASPSKSSNSPASPTSEIMTGEDGSHFNDHELDSYRNVDVHKIPDADVSNISPPKTTAYVILLAAFAAIGGFLFGYDTGVVSGAMLLLRDEFSLSSVEQEVVVSVTIGAAFVTALFGGFLSDRFGRKLCTIGASFVFTAGAIVLGVAQNVAMLIAGRLILGLGIGIASMTVPVYIAEVAPSHLRGRLLTINFIFTLVGVWLVERIGRKPLLLASLAGVILSLVVLAVGFQLNAFNSPDITFNETLHSSSCFSYRSCESCIEDKGCGFCYPDISGDPVNGSCVAATDDHDHAIFGRCAANSTVPGTPMVWAYEYCPTPYSWIAIFGLALYLMFFAPGMGPMPWTINAEMYPLWARSTGNSMSAATNWISNLVVSMTFLTLTETLTKYGTYWLFVGIASLGFLFLLCLLPETKGKKLEDVEELFARPWCACGQQNKTAPISNLNVQ